MSAPDNIQTLGPTATFYDWFNSYNTKAIAKLNKMYIYDAKAGDGITLQGNTFTGGYTFAISDNITKGITFSGRIAFTNSISFPTGTQLGSVARTFTGNYLAGACVGTVVRVTSTGGITRAQANDRTNAESIGVVTAISTTSATVALIGEISGASLTTKLLGAGTFSTGCVYFLSTTTPGGVTVTEPTGSGTVSKPILIATGVTGAIVLPYRGQYIDLVGVSGACGEGLDTIVIPITSEGDTEANFKLRPGSVMAVSSASYTEDYISPTSLLKYRKATFQTPMNELLGIVSSYVGPYSATSGDTVYLLVQPIGSVVDFDDLGWSTDLRDSGYIYLDSSGNPTKVISSEYTYSIGSSVQGSFIFAPASISTSGSIGSASTSKATKNHLINGSLLLWQRKDRGDITGITWTSGVTGGYFADRWCILNTNPSGQTFNILRQDFAKNQIEVPGYPQHYFNLSGTTVGASNTFYIENRTEDARTHAGKEMTFSFYARNKTASPTQSVVPYVKQFKQVLDTPSLLSGSTLSISSSSWTRYYSTFIVPVPTGSTFDPEGYFAMGLKMADSTINVDFAQFMLEEGRTYSTPDMVNLDDEYRKSGYYYQRSYAAKDQTGSRTKWLSNLNGPLGGFITGNPISTAHVEKIVRTSGEMNVSLPIRMRKISNFDGYTASDLPYVSVGTQNVKYADIYSPLDGVYNDAYNISANFNLRNTQGTISQTIIALAYGVGLNEATISSTSAAFYNTRRCLYCDLTTTPTISGYVVPNVDGSVSTLYVEVAQGYVLFDEIAFHYVLDLDLYQGLT
jgi:hypothetical protein